MKQRIMMIVFSFALGAILVWGWSSIVRAEMINPNISRITSPLKPATGKLPSSVGQSGAIKFVRTIPVTPDENFTSGALGYVHYIPATNRFVFILQTYLTEPVTVTNSSEVCTMRAVGYKEYYTDMTPTGKHGFFACSMTDLSSLMLGNTLYFASFKEGQPPESPVWILAKFDAVAWEKQGEVEIPLDYPYEQVGGMTIGYVNGQIVMSGEYWAGGETGGPTHSHHHFFSLNLEPMGERLLLDIQHIPMLSMLETENAIFVLGSTSLDGDLLMMKYSKTWVYQESKILRPQANFPQGAVRDDQRFYVTYADTSQRINNQWYPNVRLAAYNNDWNTLDNVAVTAYLPSDPLQPAGHWVMKHGDQLYVSYIEVSLNPDGSLDDHSFQTYVNVYELAHNIYLPLVLHNYDSNCPGGYGATGTGMGLVGVRRSTDGGVTWQDLGHACLNSNSISPADPSPLAIDVGAALFLFDGATGQTSPTILRATTTDGTHFTTFEPALVYPEGITDPFILQMPNGCRMYFCGGTGETSGTKSAWSDDCITFAAEAGARLGNGVLGAPGALLLPDGRVRLFGSGAWESEPGILSFISNDGGLTFTQEPGLRIPLIDGLPSGAQHPIPLHQGGYIMAFNVIPIGQNPYGDIIYIAHSTDGFIWTVDPKPVGIGNMPGIVETADGTLYIYYLDFNYLDFNW